MASLETEPRDTRARSNMAPTGHKKKTCSDFLFSRRNGIIRVEHSGPRFTRGFAGGPAGGPRLFVAMGSGTMSTWRYERWKEAREEEEKRYVKRCARYYASHQATSPPANETEWLARCPCALDPLAENHEPGCAYLTFDNFPPEDRRVAKTEKDRVLDAVLLCGIVFFFLWVGRIWRRVRREDRERALAARLAEEKKARESHSGRHFVAVAQPDDSVELAEIVVERDEEVVEKKEEDEDVDSTRADL